MNVNTMSLKDDFNNLLTLSKSRPYLFRTRLERVLERAMCLGRVEFREDVQKECKKLQDKLGYISDQSNQTSDGTLKSFSYLKNDIFHLFNLIKE